MANQRSIYMLAHDTDFIARLTVAAAILGEPYPESWARQHALECVVKVQTAASNYQTVIEDPYRDHPALNPKIVSDTHIKDMVSAVQADIARAITPPVVEPVIEILGDGVGA